MNRNIIRKYIMNEIPASWLAGTTSRGLTKGSKTFAKILARSSKKGQLVKPGEIIKKALKKA